MFKKKRLTLGIILLIMSYTSLEICAEGGLEPFMIGHPMWFAVYSSGDKPHTASNVIEVEVQQEPVPLWLMIAFIVIAAFFVGALAILVLTA